MLLGNVSPRVSVSRGAPGSRASAGSTVWSPAKPFSLFPVAVTSATYLPPWKSVSLYPLGLSSCLILLEAPLLLSYETGSWRSPDLPLMDHPLSLYCLLLPVAVPKPEPLFFFFLRSVSISELSRRFTTLL